MKKFVSPKNGPSAQGDIVSLRAGKTVGLRYSHGECARLYFTATHEDPDGCGYYGILKDGRVALVRIICSDFLHLYIAEEDGLPKEIKALADLPSSEPSSEPDELIGLSVRRDLPGRTTISSGVTDEDSHPHIRPRTD